MKQIILTVLVSMVGVIAFAGGITYENASIYFQADSVSVNAINNKSLCFDGENFRATYSVCVIRQRDNEGGDCLKRAKVNSYQPASSTQLTPIYEAGEGNRNIIGFERTQFEQSPVLDNVKVFREEGDGSKRLIDMFSLTVKSCR